MRYKLAALMIAVLFVVGVMIFASFVDDTPKSADKDQASYPNVGDNLTRLALYSSGFQPADISIPAGSQLEVRSVDGQEHRFIIDELNIGVAVPPRTLKTISFADAEPGTYTFYNDRFAVDGEPVSGTITIT